MACAPASKPLRSACCAAPFDPPPLWLARVTRSAGACIRVCVKRTGRFRPEPKTRRTRNPRDRSPLRFFASNSAFGSGDRPDVVSARAIRAKAVSILKQAPSSNILLLQGAYPSHSPEGRGRGEGEGNSSSRTPHPRSPPGDESNAISFSRRVFAREWCQTAMSNGPQPVARMSGAISGYDRRAFMPLPDFASLIRATILLYDSLPAKKERKWNAGRRTLRCPPAYGVRGAPRRRRLAPPFRFGRARLPAFHHGTCGSDRTPPLSSSSRASWDGTR